MPEMLEVESYRQLAQRCLHRTIAAVDAPDAWYLKDGLSSTVLTEMLRARQFDAARRTGKLLMLDISDGPVLGLHFGMTGRLVVDGDVGAVDGLLYGPSRIAAAWVRFTVRFDDGGAMAMVDARRLGGITLEPDETALGPDAALVTRKQLTAIVECSRAPIKAVLMDQRRLAGLGNLLTDEALWRAGLHPGRPANDLDAAEIIELHKAIRDVIRICGQRGGSHTGDLVPHRQPGGVCPRTGVPLERLTIGGRTTWFSPARQLWPQTRDASVEPR